MTRMNFGRHSGIVVDVCRSHGTWFDRGELDAVLEFVRAGGIETEVDASPHQAPDPEHQRLVRALQGELSVEAMQERRSVERATRIADSLLSLLFAPFT
jgi:Zn-finger nucleic acid-binding protein